MLLHPIEVSAAEILPCGVIIFTPMELTVIALARSEGGRLPAQQRPLAQALFTNDQLLTGRFAGWTLSDARLEALRQFVNALHRRRGGEAFATRTLQEAGFSSAQETWLRSECAQPL